MHKALCLVEQLTLFHPVPCLVFAITAQLGPYLGSPGSHLLTVNSFSMYEKIGINVIVCYHHI